MQDATQSLDHWLAVAEEAILQARRLLAEAREELAAAKAKVAELEGRR